MSSHPEDERLASAHPLEVTVYSRPGCHLCEEAKGVMQPLLKEFGGVMREVNIDKDPELAERYGWDIPVVFIGQHKAAKHRVDPRQFRRQMQEARAGAGEKK
jgi:glutaredoxin